MAYEVPADATKALELMNGKSFLDAILIVRLAMPVMPHMLTSASVREGAGL